jgi:hypothetical protein
MLSKSDFLEEIFGTSDLDEVVKMDLDRFRTATLKRSTKLSLPYSLPIDELPAPIPTAYEIAKCKQTENDLTHRRPICGASVYRVNDVYAVKIASHPAIVQVSQSNYGFFWTEIYIY